MRRLLTAVFLFTVCAACCQTQSKIIVRENTTQPEEKKKQEPDPRIPLIYTSESMLKINLSAIFRSDYCLSYEKKITRKLSAELTGGITYYDRFFESVDFLNYRPQNMAKASRKYEIGPSAKAAVRYYFTNDKTGISGPYLGAEAMFRRYLANAQNSYTYPASVKEHNDHKELRLQAGWQGSDRNDLTFYDCALGLGYRLHQRSYLGYSDASNPVASGLVSSHRNYFVFLINIKIGFLLD